MGRRLRPDLNDVMRARAALDDHPGIVEVTDGRDRIEQGWPLWFRAAAAL